MATELAFGTPDLGSMQNKSPSKPLCLELVKLGPWLVIGVRTDAQKVLVWLGQLGRRSLGHDARWFDEGADLAWFKPSGR